MRRDPHPGEGAMPPSSAVSATAPPAWPDTPRARAAAIALLQALNDELLAHASATLTLERWCAAHGLVAPEGVLAERVDAAPRPLPDELRGQLGVGADTPVKYRHVRLTCAGRVLSEAENWYLSGRLDAAMNHRLDTGATPFGKAVLALGYRRQTLEVRRLWAPTSDSDWPAATAAVLRHRALLVDGEGRPFAALEETYTGELLALARR
ncbi:hypothetical protein [Aerosticca soli]|nr:hypothetical protein [Aerosticca soli]